MPKEVEITITKKFYTAETAFRYARRGLISYGELNDTIKQLRALLNAYPKDKAIATLLGSYLELGTYRLDVYDRQDSVYYFDDEKAAILSFEEMGYSMATLFTDTTVKSLRMDNGVVVAEDFEKWGNA